MAVTKRVIWMDDEEWATTKAEADKTNMTVSAYIRFAIGHLNLEFAQPEPFRGPSTREDVDDIYGGVAPAGRTVLEPGGFNTRPFTPVPKSKPKH